MDSKDGLEEKVDYGAMNISPSHQNPYEPQKSIFRRIAFYTTSLALGAALYFGSTFNFEKPVSPVVNGRVEQSDLHGFSNTQSFPGYLADSSSSSSEESSPAPTSDSDFEFHGPITVVELFGYSNTQSWQGYIGGTPRQRFHKLKDGVIKELQQEIERLQQRTQQKPTLLNLFLEGFCL